MIVLSWDTSGSSQAVALAIDGKIQSEIFHLQNSSHSESLLVSVETVLKEASLELKAVDLFAVTVGPGSFTGLRTGIAVLKAFAQVWNRPVAPVSSLEALAEPWWGREGLVIPCLDARLAEVFTAVCRESHCSAEQVVSVAGLSEDLRRSPEQKFVLGSGALAYRDILKEIPGVEISEEPATHLISGSSVAKLGEKMFREGRAVPARDVQPRYLRLSEAEKRLARTELA